MKREDLFKFAMTAVCAAVLSACGSSGGDSKPSTGSTSTINKPDMTKPEAGKTEEGKAETGKTEEGKAETGKTEEGKAEAGKTEEGDKGATDDKPLTIEPDNTLDHSNVGFKHVVKKESGFVLNSSKTDSNPKGTVERTGSDTPAAMTVQDPFPSLDTIIVAEPAANTAPRGYLEDFDFRAAGKKAAEVQTAGKFTLEGIYLEEPGTTDERLAHTSKNRPGTERAETITKTKTKGDKMGDVLLYQTGRMDYTNNYKKDGKLFDAEGNLVARVEGTATAARLDDGVVKGTVAEVYGYRTFANDDALAANGKDPKVFTDAEAPNLPLVDTTKEHKAQLKNVQYGRVTSSLSGHAMKDYKDGIDLGQIKTFVVSYGKFGDEKTENHYFYRGINNISKNDLAALKAKVGDGKLVYQGHAVSYGLDNNYISDADLKAPTAIGAQLGLVSGNHVTATVDLKEKWVDGHIFNQWYHSIKGLKPSELVTFKGRMADNGNIAGESTNVKTGEKGTFGASLFGKEAEELGGVVASHDKVKNPWGAVFGAIREKEPAPIVKPQQPDKKVEDNLVNGVDNTPTGN